VDSNNKSHVFVVIRESYRFSSFLAYYTIVRLKGKNPELVEGATKQQNIGTKTIHTFVHDITFLSAP
jgi:hypothetical protein